MQSPLLCGEVLEENEIEDVAVFPPFLSHLLFRVWSPDVMCTLKKVGIYSVASLV